MTSPDLASVRQRLAAIRLLHDPVATRNLHDFHEFYKKTQSMVASVMGDVAQTVIDEATVKLFRDVLGLDDSTVVTDGVIDVGPR